MKKGHEERLEAILSRSQIVALPSETGRRKQLEDRVALFQNGEWDVLLEKSLDSSMDGATSNVRRRRNVGDSVEKRARRALQMVQLSAGRQALEGASLAPGDKKTLAALKDPNRRPALPRNSVPEEMAQFALVEHLSHAASLLARNEMPEEVMVAIRCGRITALLKPDGGSQGHCCRGHIQEIRRSNHCPALQSQG